MIQGHRREFKDGMGDLEDRQHLLEWVESCFVQLSICQQLSSEDFCSKGLSSDLQRVAERFLRWAYNDKSSELHRHACTRALRNVSLIEINICEFSRFVSGIDHLRETPM